MLSAHNIEETTVHVATTTHSGQGSTSAPGSSTTHSGTAPSTAHPSTVVPTTTVPATSMFAIIVALKKKYICEICY